ncbi:hypothetical protein AAVH_24765 [Aphelenchoides avenae]|nr:hypothetical protein AAVH_24765 [Aphelenchus avenae]
MWNRSDTGILPRHRRFDLCAEPPAMIYDITRNSVGNVRFHPRGTDSWSCLLWILRGATNFTVVKLEVFAYTQPSEVNTQSLQETVELGEVRSLHVRFSSHSHPLDHNLVVACGSVRGISDLALEIIAVSF